MSFSSDQCIACRLYSFRSVATRKVRDSRVRANPAVVALRVNDCSMPVPPPWLPAEAGEVASNETRGMKPVAVADVDAIDVAVDGRSGAVVAAIVVEDEGGDETGDRIDERSGAEEARETEAGGLLGGDATMVVLSILRRNPAVDKLKLRSEKEDEWRRCFLAFDGRVDDGDTSLVVEEVEVDRGMLGNGAITVLRTSSTPNSSMAARLALEVADDATEDTLNSDDTDKRRLVVHRGGDSSIEDSELMLEPEPDREVRLRRLGDVEVDIERGSVRE